ncbi:hypothetical protein LSAT2_021278 [Lamellibrachia satsuma]|nr:hypothetical protein LSAT2_021278 [Lamellibrachia satsuma]
MPKWGGQGGGETKVVVRPRWWGGQGCGEAKVGMPKWGGQVGEAKVVGRPRWGGQGGEAKVVGRPSRKRFFNLTLSDWEVMEDIDSDPDELYSKINKQSPFKQNGCTNVAPVEDTNLDKNDNVAMCKEEQVQLEKHTDLTCIVELEETEASRRCNLGNAEYRLCVDASGLKLQVQHIVLFNWPYKFIRRYGTGQGLFLVEVGRGAASGEGLFKFRTTTPDQIQTAVKARMNRGSRRCTTPAAVEDLYATVNKPKRNSDKV